MTTTDREQELVRAFVGLADTLVSDYDVVGLLSDLVDHCVHLLRADAAGILLTDPRGGLQVMASSSEHARLLELLQQQTNEGPCVDCVGSGQPVSVPDLAECAERWPRFVPAAHAEDYQAVDAVPMRLREEVIGALNLFRHRTGAMPPPDLRVAQALADVATIGILSERAIRHRGVVVAQLQGALNSRVIIEQAKGMLAASGATDMDHAFHALRAHARATGSRLSEIATLLVEGTFPPRPCWLPLPHLGTDRAPHPRCEYPREPAQSWIPPFRAVIMSVLRSS
ncbi:MAG: GAF and ANTAR domain-containing protein [Intrasporangium sp.]|uniref:GAF and ANTAR domain-containing protein n=1 Tax=Intrasporangium sp. TaxID=1925024 RepID=UPI0026477F9A|nr:GAF and ANTAR domain-containing protein [Intrasporangium sp.]MDN5797415.1 GAF and ANTAR domain-containing protein [Intrasporangium sp.]